MKNPSGRTSINNDATIIPALILPDRCSLSAMTKTRAKSVAVEQNQRSSDHGENSQPDQRESQATVFSEMSNHPGATQKQRAKIRSRLTFDFCPLTSEF